MTTELEERLRQRMEHATAQIQVPRDLARRAGRHRHRRIVIQTGAAAATATAVAAAVVVTGTTGAPRETPATATARLVSNVESAFEAATGDDIMYLQSTGAGPDQWYYRGSQRELTRYKDFSPSGRLLADQGSIATSASDTVTFVGYGNRTWFTMTQQGNRLPAAPAPQTSCRNDISIYPTQDPATMAANIRAALACGQLTDEGTEYVNGVKAIKLVSERPVNGPVGGVFTMTLWVDPATYLPTRFESIITINGHANSTVRNVTWLAPTSANLAQLQPPVPAGFTRIEPPANRLSQALNKAITSQLAALNPAGSSPSSHS